MTELSSKIEETIFVVDNALNTLSEEEFKKEFPLLVFENDISNEFMLTHLTTHFTYHLGQINYFRRLLKLKKYKATINLLFLIH